MKGTFRSQIWAECSFPQPFYFLSLPTLQASLPRLHALLTQPPQVQNGIFVPAVVVIVQDLQGGHTGKTLRLQPHDSRGPLTQRSRFRRSWASFGEMFRAEAETVHLGPMKSNVWRLGSNPSVSTYCLGGCVGVTSHNLSFFVC